MTGDERPDDDLKAWAEWNRKPGDERPDVQQATAWVMCPHPDRSRSGGNDYIRCGECGFEWDYRRDHDPQTHAIRALIAAVRDQGATPQEQGEDHGAGLIHQTIPDVEGTEPRLNSVLAEFIEDPYASGRFENLGCQGLPEDVYNELLRVAADKHVSVYYLAAIYKRGQADALASIEDQDSYLWERCYKCGHRLAFASDSCPQCGVHFVDGDDPPNWPEKCQCDRCMEARTNEQD